MEKYSPQKIEKKWQAKWQESNVYKTEMDPAKPKYYTLYHRDEEDSGRYVHR